MLVVNPGGCGVLPALIGGAGSPAWSSLFPANLTCWLENAGEFSDVGASIPCADGDLIYWWQDQKSTNHFSQSVGGQRPVYNTNQINGLPAATYDRTIATRYVSGPLLLTGSKSHTVFIVLSRTTLQAYNAAFCYGSSVLHGGGLFIKSNGATAWFIPNVVATPSWYVYDGTGSATYGNGTPYVMEAVCDVSGGVGTTYQNGTLDGTVSITGSIDLANAIDGHWLGSYPEGGSDYSGLIAEFLFYSRVLNSSERSLTRHYLGDKWGIAVV